MRQSLTLLFSCVSKIDGKSDDELRRKGKVQSIPIVVGGMQRKESRRFQFTCSGCLAYLWLPRNLRPEIRAQQKLPSSFSRQFTSVSVNNRLMTKKITADTATFPGHTSSVGSSLILDNSYLINSRADMPRSHIMTPHLIAATD